MSTFKVEIVRISQIEPHPNADRLDIASIEGMGYRVVVGRGHFAPGGLAYYFPVDSVIPEPYLDEFGIRPYYSKKLRAAKLRGVFSEGLLVPADKGAVGDDCTAAFGVTKYEYPIPQSMCGEAESAIGQYKFPGPEHLKRYAHLLQLGEPVIVTEKIHGTTFTVFMEAEGVPRIGSHNYFWKNSEANASLVYVRAYRENACLHRLPAGTQVFGEIYGVQDLKYGLGSGRIALALFAVRQDSRFFDYAEFVAFCDEYALPRVPVLYSGPYSWEAVTAFNNADSTLDSRTLMEGVVVQPERERSDPEVGRVVLKFISDRYQLRKEGTELH